MNTRRRRPETWLALCICLALNTNAWAQDKPPKLAVIVVIDQLGWQTLEQLRPNLGKDGVQRLMREGSVFTSAHYTHAVTYTGPGHACIASGSYADQHGIISNNYYDRTTGKSSTMLADLEHPLLDAPPDPEDDTSPRNFIGETVGDRLRLATNLESRVVAIALKDRAAVLLGGRLGTSYWMSEATGKMTSSTWYMKELPAWVKRFNETKPVEASFGKSWTRALPEASYLGKDDQPFESDAKGLGRTFPHPIGNSAAFLSTPLATDWEVEFIKAAVTAEQLGKRGGTDLLAVSFSANDYIGHNFGPESHEVQDAVVRMDQSVANLLGFLEKEVGGKQNLTVVFTSDHGATPTPEFLVARGYPAGRIKNSALKDALNKALGEKFGAGDWVLALEDPGVYLNDRLALERKVDFTMVQQVAAQAAVRVPGIATAFTRAQLTLGPLPATPMAQAMLKSFYPSRSGDLFLVTQPFYFWGKFGEKTVGSTHGSPYSYDTHVPLVFWGRGVRRGEHRAAVDLADLAPTLAALLGLSPPAAAEGQTRAEVFP